MANLVFIGSGFGIVMGVLAALWGICAAVGWAFRRLETEVATPPAETVTAGTPPGHVAAIAAAVASLPGAWRVVSVAAPPHVAVAWAEQGRLGRHDVPRSRFSWAAPGRKQPSASMDFRNQEQAE